MVLLAALGLSRPLQAKDGFIDKSGRLVIPALFDRALSFSEGLAAVQRGGKCGYVDRTGAVRIQPTFDDARRFREGRAAVKVGEKWGFIDPEGRWVKEPTYVQASGFSEGLAAVAVPIVLEPLPQEADSSGAAALPFKPRAGISLGDSTKAFRASGGWGYIDRAGALVIAHQFFEAHDFSDGRAMVRRRGGHEILATAEERARFAEDPSSLRERFAQDYEWGAEVAGFIDRTGAMAIPPRFSRAMPFREGLAWVEESAPGGRGFKGFIDPAGAPVIRLDPSALMAGPWEDWTGLDDRFGFEPVNLEVVKKWRIRPLPAHTVGAGAFREGLALVDSATGSGIHVPKWTFVDRNGTPLPVTVGERSQGFSEGLAAVKKGGPSGKTGYLDRKGTLVIPFSFKEADRFSEGLAPVRIEKRWGYVDPKGTVVIEARFEAAAPFSDGLAAVRVPD